VSICIFLTNSGTRVSRTDEVGKRNVGGWPTAQAFLIFRAQEFYREKHLCLEWKPLYFAFQKVMIRQVIA
jgi:hypothetical protein